MTDALLIQQSGQREDSSRFQQMPGALWLRGCFKVETSDFGAKVAHLLDRMVNGIYHFMPLSALMRAEWNSHCYVELTWYRGMATYDYGHLTRFVLLCHELSIRGEIRPCNPNHLRLGFSRRIRNGGMMDGHPTMERVLIGFRGESEEAEGSRG